VFGLDGVVMSNMTGVCHTKLANLKRWLSTSAAGAQGGGRGNSAGSELIHEIYDKLKEAVRNASASSAMIK